MRNHSLQQKVDTILNLGVDEGAHVPSLCPGNKIIDPSPEGHSTFDIANSISAAIEPSDGVSSVYPLLLHHCEDRFNQWSETIHFEPGFNYLLSDDGLCEVGPI